MEFKALHLLVAGQLLSSYFFICVSCQMTILHSPGNATNTTETTTVIPTTANMSTAATNVSTTASHATSTTASPAPGTPTTKSPMTASSTQPLVTNPTGVTNSTSQSPATSTFDAGSFVGGMFLALTVTIVLYLGYKFSCSRQEVRYRSIEEHDAII